MSHVLKLSCLLGQKNKTICVNVTCIKNSVFLDKKTEKPMCMLQILKISYLLGQKKKIEQPVFILQILKISDLLGPKKKK